MKLLPALALIGFGAGVAHAQDNPAPLYHVQQDTFGCANPSFTRTLTNPQESRRNNRRWVRDTMTEGRCVTITPRSPWKLVSLEGDVALMTYAGDAGPPGAYYLTVADLTDGTGQHPGDGVAASSAPAGSRSASAPPDSTSATALAPPPANATGTESQPYSDLPPMPPASGLSYLTTISWILAIAGFIALAAILVWHSRRLARIERGNASGDAGLRRAPALHDKDQYPGGGPGGYPAGGGGG